MCLNSIISFRELLLLMYCMTLLGDRFGGHDTILGEPWHLPEMEVTQVVGQHGPEPDDGGDSFQITKS